MDKLKLIAIIKRFLSVLEEENVKIQTIESGLINSTFKVVNDSSAYILQRMNTEIFKSPEGIQTNIISVANHLQENGYPRMTLSIVRTQKNELLYKDEDNSVWRMFQYIPSSRDFNVVPSGEHAFEAAKSLGEFHQYLSNFNAENLTSPISGFLDFEQRRKQYQTALRNGQQERMLKAGDAIEFIEKYSSLLEEYQKIEASLPKRVIHGDPKISNFLFDENTTQVRCIIDWDTIMQGSILYDFGDMVRSFTNKKEESDASSSPVFNAAIFNAIKEGYLVHQKDALSPLELENLMLGAKTVIYIQAMRFLTDYLNGDNYFRINYPNQNLDRTKNQIQLLSAILNN